MSIKSVDLIQPTLVKSEKNYLTKFRKDLNKKIFNKIPERFK